MRRKLVGSSGAVHEIDILARRQQQQNKVLAVECKNYSEARVVGIKEVRDFQSKIQDLPQITDAMFVTNTKFSSEAETYANHNHITLYDGDKLKSDFYLMSIGRLESIPDIVLDSTLPLNMSYNEATRLDLVNPNAARIARATLVLRPFYVFDYIIEETKRGFLRGSRPREEGMHIIDCLNGEILYKSHNVQSNSQSSYYLLSKSRIHHKDSEEVLSNIEKNQIIEDLQTIKPQFKCKIHPTGEYAIIKLESKVPMDAARRMIKEEIVEEKKIADYDNVGIIDRASSCIYVPKWVINIESHNTTYTMEILAASNTILIDEMAYCPREFFARFRPSRKQTYAICERCGGAYCSRHIERVNDSYFCREHR